MFAQVGGDLEQCVDVAQVGVDLEYCVVYFPGRRFTFCSALMLSR